MKENKENVKRVESQCTVSSSDMSLADDKGMKNIIYEIRTFSRKWGHGCDFSEKGKNMWTKGQDMQKFLKNLKKMYLSW